MSSSLNDGTVLAALEALPRDGLLAVEAPLDGTPEPLILHRAADGGVRAWLNVCPHAGRRLDYAPGKFLRSKAGELVCAVHGATFTLEDGRCVAGPCRGESLRAVAVHCADGQVRLGAAQMDQ
ncbi:Rieske (2Fe-2S) protein [Thermomonas sp.]|uniref:Rieske (2Fe-2S) protein n=1 Tax=Thermomonas sp. TaxID=1971895 RepID=UPI001AC8C879|nr:Rieske (2Fe-2S) protein [Xanthomonadales bacterium]MBN8794721.1 Rieske (2Fe-2S) protein [Stenotrophomonas nitritireducens]